MSSRLYCSSDLGLHLASSHFEATSAAPGRALHVGHYARQAPRKATGKSLAYRIREKRCPLCRLVLHHTLSHLATMRISTRYLAILLLCALASTCTVTAGLSDRTKKSIDHLWKQVEEKMPVEEAKTQNVVDPPSHVDPGPDPTRKSEYR